MHKVTEDATKEPCQPDIVERVPLAALLKRLGPSYASAVITPLLYGALNALVENIITFEEAENFIFNPDMLLLAQQQDLEAAIVETIEYGMELSDIATLVNSAQAYKDAIAECAQLLEPQKNLQKRTDKHLNLFYTYNRDAELIENNLTRAFIVVLSAVSGETRHHLLSALLEKSRKMTQNPAGIARFDFTNACFALQSNIDRSIPQNSSGKVLLTISTEPLDLSSHLIATEMAQPHEDNDERSFASVPDAWIYNDTYCLLLEVKVGDYPLNIGQLHAHARDWFGLSLNHLRSHHALCSVTWIDVLEALDAMSKERAYIHPVEETLLQHIREFVGYYGYRLFAGIDFGALDAPPDFAIAALLPSDASIDTLFTGINLQLLAPPPDFMLALTAQ